MSDTILLNISGQEATPNICIQTETEPINLTINERLVETTVWDDLIGTVNYIPFNTSPTGVPETAGTAYWNSTDGTVSFKLLNGTDLQNGQELFFYGKAVGAIANGDLCQFAGVQGDHILIKKAVGSEIDANPSYIVGIATQNIANGEFGYVTWFGKVNGVFTTGWSIGDILYFDVVTGQLTNVMPTAPNRVIEIAAVIKTATGASENGVLIVRPTFGKRFTDLDDVNGTALTTSGQIPVWDNINQVFDFTVNVHGKAPYHGVVSIGTLSFNNSTHVLSVPTLTYWNQGVLVEHTTTVSCDLDSFVSVTSTPMLYFVYFDSNNVFRASTTPWDIKTDVLIATVSWNGSVGVIGNECHGYTRNLDWHQNAHLTVGTRYETGLAQTAPSTTLDSTIDLSAGVLWDEDIRISIAQQTQCRVWYRNTNGTYTFDSTPSSAPYKWNGATSRVQYLDTDTNTLVDLTAAQYVPMWVYGTSDTTVPIYVLVGEISAPYTSVAAARAATPPVLASSPLNPESKLLYRWIYRGDGQYQEAVDYRSSSSLPAGGTPATNAASVTFSPSGNIAATNVQSAVEELDSETVKLTGDQSIAGNKTFTGNTTLGDAEATDTHTIKGATTLLASSSSAALTVTQTGTGNALVIEDSDSPDSTPVSISSVGSLRIGHTSSIPVGVFANPYYQQHGISSDTNSFAIYSWQTGVDVASNILFARADGNIRGDFTDPVDSGDVLGNIRFYGNDGSGFVESAKVSAAVDGTPDTNDMPGRLVFSTTADGASTPTERMRITSTGNLLVGTTTDDGVNKLQVSGSIKATSIQDTPIGSTTPSTGAFTTLSATGNTTLGDAEATDTHSVKGATTLLANSSSAALTITQTGTGNALVVEDTTSPDSTPFVIDANGRVVQGASTLIPAGVFSTSNISAHQLNNATDTAFSAFAWGGGGATSARVSLARSNNSTTGTHQALVNNSVIGSVEMMGSDGESFIRAASISSSVDGTPGTGSMPGRLVFATTASGSSTPTERMRISSAGNTLIGTTTDDGINKLQVNGTAKATQWNVSNMATAPASATATGTLGEVRITATHIYVCTATNTWVRAALSTWT